MKYASTWRLKVKLLGEVEDGLAVALDAHAGDGLEACLAASTRSPSWLDWKHAHLGFGAAMCVSSFPLSVVREGLKVIHLYLQNLRRMVRVNRQIRMRGVAPMEAWRSNPN